MLILILFAFLAGLVTILSPCILPVLPIVLSGSVSEGKKRPLGIVAGFVISFTFFTLFLSAIVKATGISSDLLRNISVVLIILLGVSLVIPQAQLLFEKLFSYFSQFSNSSTKDGFWPGVAVGLSLGLLWTPCVGPILASVISLALTGSVNGSAALITFAYALGTSLPMLAITYGGRALLQKVPWLLRNSAHIQQGFGVVMVIIGVALFFNVDRQFQSWLLQKFPQYGTGLTALETNKVVQEKLQTIKKNTSDALSATAPDFTGGDGWLNSETLSLQTNLKGKVVLVDFWTYSCINCINTLPYIEKWYETYKDQGFVVVGVHSPEFEFEKKKENVAKAIADFGLTYPVVQDNHFVIWNAYNNQYWPAHYLIDQNGKIVYTHFGEGKYAETENKIRELLGQSAMPEPREGELSLASREQTPETYLGYKRAESYIRQLNITPDAEKTYQFSGQIPNDGVGLAGKWLVGSEFIQAQADGAQLHLNFAAKKVFLVIGTKELSKPTMVKVMLDGQPLTKEQLTSDMSEDGTITISDPRKYDMVALPVTGRHILSLTVSSGVQLYAFTFGS